MLSTTHYDELPAKHHGISRHNVKSTGLFETLVFFDDFSAGKWNYYRPRDFHKCQNPVVVLVKLTITTTTFAATFSNKEWTDGDLYHK